MDNSTNETGFTIQRATNSSFTSGVVSTPAPVGAGTGQMSITITGLNRNTVYWFRASLSTMAPLSLVWVPSNPVSLLAPIRNSNNSLYLAPVDDWRQEFIVGSLFPISS